MLFVSVLVELSFDDSSEDLLESGVVVLLLFDSGVTMMSSAEAPNTASLKPDRRLFFFFDSSVMDDGICTACCDPAVGEESLVDDKLLRLSQGEAKFDSCKEVLIFLAQPLGDVILETCAVTLSFVELSPEGGALETDAEHIGFLAALFVILTLDVDTESDILASNTDIEMGFFCFVLGGTFSLITGTGGSKFARASCFEPMAVVIVSFTSLSRPDLFFDCIFIFFRLMAVSFPTIFEAISSVLDFLRLAVMVTAAVCVVIDSFFFLSLTNALLAMDKDPGLSLTVSVVA
mmetsp:Transcript_14584/g.21748  ORF Transcript_14584/g.21748 Transcript_14584/m.21748 type:complete len:290 (-) Transcript_14584:2856-3725(-)